MAEGRLTGKTILVTGAARGMGRTHALRLAQEGARVILTDLADEDGKGAAAEIGEAARFYKHDVRDAASWAEVIAQAETEFGPISVLVNNAGIGYQVAFDDLTEEIYRTFFDVNQLGTFLGMKAVLPSMRKLGGGSIINVSSITGLLAYPQAVAYSSTKFAVRGMSKAAAVDLAKDNIRVNSVHPGMTRTPMLTPEIEAVLCERVPLGRAGDAKEVSSIIVYLASDDSSYCTGAEFVVDGGLTARH